MDKLETLKIDLGPEEFVLVFGKSSRVELAAFVIRNQHIYFIDAEDHEEGLLSWWQEDGWVLKEYNEEQYIEDEYDRLLEDPAWLRQVVERLRYTLREEKLSQSDYIKRCEEEPPITEDDKSEIRLGKSCIWKLERILGKHY